MDTSSETRLSKVHPELAKRVRLVADALKARGIEIHVVQGLRTFAEQDALFAQGRTTKGKKVTNARGGQSNHNFGLAVDVCPFKGGQPQWNDQKAFKAIGQEAKKLGLEWGGDWVHIVDEPHIQLPGLSVSQCLALYRKGGIGAVWGRMNGLIKPVKINSFVSTDDEDTDDPATTSPDNDPPATPQTEQGAGSEAPGPTSPQAEAKVVVAAQPEKSGALKSLWVTISGTVLAVLAWIWANIEKIFGIVKDNQIDVTTVTKWAFIAIGGVVSMYLFRQLVLDAIRIASSTFLTHTEAQIAANPDLHDVKIASPAPKEGDA
jgi:hypothetical protein